MVKEGEHKSIGILHGSLMVHELLHSEEITRQEEEAEARDAIAHESIDHSPDIRGERRALRDNAAEGVCFNLFSWIHF